MVASWFTASPGLRQTDETLAGWGCTAVVHESNHGTQDKPAITTHTQERASVIAAYLYIHFLKSRDTRRMCAQLKIYCDFI